MSLLYAAQQFTIYVGLFLVITGLIGNIFTVLVFSTVRNYRITPSSFYFLTIAIVNIFFVPMNIITRVVSVGYGIDLTRTSLAWCKIRLYLIAAISLISFTCLCLASIDQFLITSRSIHLRNLSNIKWARRMVLITIIVSCIHSIPGLIYMDISMITQTCINTNSGFAVYISIYVLVFTCIIPTIIMIVYGYLTHRNIRLTRALVEQQADHQLTRMTLTQVIVVVITIIPYSVNTVYALITTGITKDLDRSLKELLAITITSMLANIYYVVCLFILYQILKKLFF